MARFIVRDYTDPGESVKLGTVIGATWDEANRKAQSKWPRRVLSVGK